MAEDDMEGKFPGRSFYFLLKDPAFFNLKNILGEKKCKKIKMINLLFFYFFLYFYPLLPKILTDWTRS